MIKIHSTTADLKVSFDDRNRQGLSPQLSKTVDDLWERELKNRPHVTNGNILCLNSYENDPSPGQAISKVTVGVVPYKQIIAQYRQPDLFSELGVTNMGVNGLLKIENKFVFGKRAKHVTHDPDKWELGPSGTLDARFKSEDQSVDYTGQILEELKEEVNLDASDIGAILPVGLLENTEHHYFDIQLLLECRVSLAEFKKRLADRPTDEYQEFTFVESFELAAFLARYHSQLAVSSRAMIDYILRTSL